jgi:acetyltransferase
MGMPHALEPLFHPAAVAVVGASEVPGKAAERRTRSLLEGRYPGRVYLINPKRDRLFGLKAYPSLKAVDGPLDLAMIVIPGPLIPQAVEEAAEKGAKGVIIITAGLGETGPEGRQIEARIMDIAGRHGIHVIGPNCSGMYSATGHVNFLGIPMIQAGHLAVLAQSGNIIDSLTHYARRRGRGFSRIISSGNAIGVRFHDVIDFLAADRETRVIMLYLESIRQGDELIRVCRKATRRKPIIAIKVGRTAAGRRASASHTGALAADDRIVEAACEQAGIIRVANIDEMFDLAEAFLDCPQPRGRRVAILSEGGGDNAVAADNAERWGLEVPVLLPETQERIRPHLLAGMPAHNPIDYGGTAEENPAVVAACVEAVMAADEVDMVYLTGFFGGFKDIIAPHVGPLETEASRRLVALVRRVGKPLAVHTSFALEDYEAISVLKQSGIPVHAGSERIAQCLAALARQAASARRPQAVKQFAADASRRPRVQEIVAAARREGRTNLLETEARELLGCYGLPLAPAAFARSANEAALAARSLGFPVALKIVSPDILHKSDVGGVRLNLASASAVKEAARAIRRQVAATAAAARVAGYLVSPMAPPGQECIFGIFRDPDFGPVVMFGLGGIFVEVLKDVGFGVAPLAENDVERMITSIRGAVLLAGVRGEGEKDIAAVRRLIEGLSRIACELPDLAELDLNPVIVHSHGTSVVDARIVLSA